MSLERTDVVRTALRLLDEVGLDGLTVRKLASELGVQAPALYWHFKNKQELLDEMATAVFADGVHEFGEAGESVTWDDWATEYGKHLRRMLLRYRDGARMFSGRYMTDNTLFASMESALRKFTGAGFSLPDAASGLLTIYSYAVGFTIEEQAVYPQPGERNEQYDLNKRAERIDREKVPLALAVGEVAFTRFEERFEQGLQTIIAGIKSKGGSASSSRTSNLPAEDTV
ncbi:MAG: TetR/AcrR family transcriptional regulator C-terminal domain-containing protein [Candidatus Acidiferrales bacterium]